MKNKLLITVDGIRKDKIGIYNNRNNNLTPNLDRIGNVSIVLNDMFAAASSTAMCFASIFNGKYSKDFDRKKYGDTNNPFQENIFTDLEKQGYKTYICLNRRFKFCYDMINTKGKTTEFWWTGKKNINKNLGSLRPLEQVKFIYKKLKKINQPFFIWMHLWGFSAPKKKFEQKFTYDYEARIAELDEAIGFIFDKFNKTSELIFFSDHGYSFFENSKWGYGKDGNNLVGSVTNIPAIIYNGISIGHNNNLISQISFRKIIKDTEIAHMISDKYAFCESRYLNEFDKCLAVRFRHYKFIIEFQKKKKYLYDLSFDPNENINLLSKKFFKLTRDKNGNHPEMKPYIIKSNWKVVKKIYLQLNEIVDNFYDEKDIPFLIKLKNFIKGSLIFKIYKKKL